jgi:spore germination cell wall hydrolase CwlJ-like protein
VLWSLWRRAAAEALPGVEAAFAGLLGLIVLALGFGASPVARDAQEGPSPVLRAILVQDRLLSEASLRRLGEQIGPGGRASIARLEGKGQGGRPTGWAIFDLETVPTLGFRSLSGDDARLINAVIPNSALPIEFGRPFPTISLTSPSGQRALRCLAQAVYFEAGQDDEAAQAAVAQVVLNRVRHPAYPNSICGVVYQGAMRVTGCQFSFTCDGSLQRGIMTSAWTRAEGVAKRALQGFVMKDVGVATNYHADYEAPYWARTLIRISKVGPHIFYRWTGPLGQRRALTQRYSSDETNIGRTVLASWDERTQGVDARVALRDAGGEDRAMAAALGALKAAGLVTSMEDGRVRTLINPVARKPTPEEIAAINARLAEYERGLDTPVPTAPAQSPPAAVLSTPPDAESKAPQGSNQ